MPVYAIAQGRINNREQFDKYVAAATPTLAAHNALVLAVDETPDVIEGETPYPRSVILEFQSAEAFYAWYNSPEYTAARKHRETASTGTFILLQGLSQD